MTLAVAMPAIVVPLGVMLAAQAPISPAFSGGLGGSLSGAMRPFSLAGAGAALLLLCAPRARLGALVAALSFHALQVVQYYSATIAFGFHSGIAISWTHRLPGGMVIINGVALACLLLTAWTLYRTAWPVRH